MVLKKLIPKTFLIAPVVALMLSIGVLLACGSGTEIAQTPSGGTASQESSGGERPGEHGPGGESAGETGGSGGAGSEEASGASLAPDETFDAVRSGARLILNYDPAGNAFAGTVENTTGNLLTQVRIEVHLSNGTELGPTTPVNLAPGQVMHVNLLSTQASFTGWTAHAEVGSGAEGSQAGGKTGGGESWPDGPESGAVGNEAALEAAMSSPIIPLDQTWTGVLGGLTISASYDAATRSASAVVENTTSSTLCYVQAEPHLKSGTQTVGELGPDVLGDLNPGQQVLSNVSVAGEPSLAGVPFDGYVVHMEVFDCAGPGPQQHGGGQSGEDGNEGAGGEGHGPGGEGSGGESEGSDSEESSGANLTPDESFDAVHSGARLSLNYDPNSNAFTGTVENTTGNVLNRVRIEVHLSNGRELGPTTPVDIAPGQVLAVHLPSTAVPFTGWIAHAEVGGGEGSRSSGEHGPTSGGESGREHGGRGEGSGGG